MLSPAGNSQTRINDVCEIDQRLNAGKREVGWMYGVDTKPAVYFSRRREKI